MLADAQHTTDQRQTESCEYQRQGTSTEEFQSTTTENIRNLLKEIKLKNVAQTEHELMIEASNVLRNTSRCPEEERPWKTIIGEDRVQQQELSNLSNQLQLIIRQQLQRDEQLLLQSHVQQNPNQFRQLELLIKQKEKQQEQQQNQSRQIGVLIKQNEKQQEQQLNQSRQNKVLVNRNENHQEQQQNQSEYQQKQQQNQSCQIEVIIKQNEKQLEQQSQQREHQNNVSAQHQLILQQLQVQQKEQQTRFKTIALELKAILSHQEQGKDN